MPVIAVKVGDYLTPERIQQLRGRSDLVGILLVLHAWALIAGSMVLFAWWPNPLTFLLGVMVIGGRQLGLAILMHDAAHGLLFADRRLNDRVGAGSVPIPSSPALRSTDPTTCNITGSRNSPGTPIRGHRLRSRSAAEACNARSCAILRDRLPT